MIIIESNFNLTTDSDQVMLMTNASATNNLAVDIVEYGSINHIDLPAGYDQWSGTVANMPPGEIWKSIERWIPGNEGYEIDSSDSDSNQENDEYCFSTFKILTRPNPQAGIIPDGDGFGTCLINPGVTLVNTTGATLKFIITAHSNFAIKHFGVIIHSNWNWTGNTGDVNTAFGTVYVYPSGSTYEVHITNIGMSPNTTRTVEIINLDAPATPQNNTFYILTQSSNGTGMDYIFRSPVQSVYNALANHVVINEVSTYGDMSYSAEFIELYNPVATKNISGWILADDSTPAGTDYEGVIMFPSGTYISNLKYLIIARDAEKFYQSYGFWPDFEYNPLAYGDDSPFVPNMVVWESNLDLETDIDQVMLLTGTNELQNYAVDIVEYGKERTADLAAVYDGWNGSSAFLEFGEFWKSVERWVPGCEGYEIDSSDADSNQENDEYCRSTFKYLTRGNPEGGFIYPTLKINKSASFSLHGAPLSSPKPGSTIQYVISFSNNLTQTATNFVIYDEIYSYQTYVSNSIITTNFNGSSVGYTNEWTSSTNPDNGYSSTDYFHTIEPLSTNIKWIRTKKSNISTTESGNMLFKAYAGNAPAGYSLANRATVNATNAYNIRDTLLMTMGTNYGGRFSGASNQTATNLPSTNYFSFNLTNKGNISVYYKLSIYYTNASPDFSNWTWDIVTNNVSITQTPSINKDDSFSFSVRVIANAGLSHGDYFKFKIKAQVDNNTSATNYTGDDGKEYGGDIGEDCDGNMNPSYFGFICPQVIRTNVLTISLGVVTTATLYISKSISNIILAGTPLSKPIPGSTVIYRISYSNLSAIGANNSVIYDALPKAGIYLTNFMGTATGWTVQFSTNNSPEQNYFSTDYSNWYTMMSNLQWRTNLKWIRWLKPLVPSTEDGLTLYYKIIIK